MSKKKLERRIAELERRVKELEERPDLVYYPSYPIWVVPYWEYWKPSPSPWAPYWHDQTYSGVSTWVAT